MLEKNTSSCLSGDMGVLVYDGKIFKEVNIKDLFNNREGLRIVSFNEDCNFHLQDISKVFHSGVKPVYRINFEGVIHLECTEDHRLFMSNDYIGEYVTLKDFGISVKDGDVFINSKIMDTRFFTIDADQIYRKFKDLRFDDEMADDLIFIPLNRGYDFQFYNRLKVNNIEYVGEVDT